jgi:hypothetical protein
MAGASKSRCVPFDQWPSTDRAAWQLSCRPGDPFDDIRRGAELRATSQEKIRKG